MRRPQLLDDEFEAWLAKVPQEDGCLALPGDDGSMRFMLEAGFRAGWERARRAARQQTKQRKRP